MGVLSIRWFAASLLLLVSCQSGSDLAEQTSGAAAAESTSAEHAPLSTPGFSASIVRFDPPAALGSIGLNLRASGNTVLATWIEPGKGSNRLRFSKWSAAGWSSPVTVVEAAGVVANWADVPSVQSAPDGALVLHWAERSAGEGHNYDAIVARSTDGGASWSRLGRLHRDATAAEHGFVSLIPDDGGVRAFWLDGGASSRPGGTTELRTAVVGESIAGEVVVDPSVCDCCQTTAAATIGGPIVVYRDRTKDEIRDVWASRLRGGQWSPSSPIAMDGWKIAGCPVNGPSMDARDGLVAVGWYTYANSQPRVRVAFSEDDGATFGAAIDVDAARGAHAPIGRVSAVVDGGSAIVSWISSEREQASILVRRVSRGGAMGPPLLVAQSKPDRDTGFPRMIRFGNDVVISWTEPGPEGGVHAGRLALADLPATGSPRVTIGAEAAARSRLEGKPAPNLAAKTLEGVGVELSSLRGGVVLLNLWATWCEPCRQELRLLAGLHEKNQSRGLTVVALSVDRERTIEDISSFAKQRKLPFSVWHDREDRASSALDVRTLPASFLIGRDGTILWRRDGAIEADDPELGSAIDAALAAQKP